jgi:hypothetical protein
MKTTIQEAIVKPGRAFRGFKDMLSQQKMRDSQGVSELAPHISEIQSYFDEATVSFEFECILNLGTTYYSSVIEEQQVPDSINMSDVDSDIYEFLHTYFPIRTNTLAWDRLESAYHRYLDDNYEKHDYDSAEDFADDYVIEAYCEDMFNDVEDVVSTFNFSHPLHGYGDYDYEILTGEYHFEDVEVDRLQEEFYNEVYPIIKNRINRIFGNQEIYVSSEPHEYSPMFKKEHPNAWFIEPDGSLDLDDYHERVPAEVITPRWPASVAIENMKLFKEKVFDFFDGSTDESDADIGCHTNISFENRKIDMVKLILLSNTAFWASEFDREQNRYAKNQYEHLVKKVRGTNGLEDMSLDDFRDLLADQISRNKFTDINILKDEVIEFRFPGNDYFGEHFDLLINNTKWLIFSMTVAAVPELFNSQYQALLLRLKRTLNTDSSKYFYYGLSLREKLIQLAGIISYDDGTEIVKEIVDIFKKYKTFFIDHNNIKAVLGDVLDHLDHMNKPIHIKDLSPRYILALLILAKRDSRVAYTIIRAFFIRLGINNIPLH